MYLVFIPELLKDTAKGVYYIQVFDRDIITTLTNVTNSKIGKTQSASPAFGLPNNVPFLNSYVITDTYTKIKLNYKIAVLYSSTAGDTREIRNILGGNRNINCNGLEYYPETCNIYFQEISENIPGLYYSEYITIYNQNQLCIRDEINHCLIPIENPVKIYNDYNYLINNQIYTHITADFNYNAKGIRISYENRYQRTCFRIGLFNLQEFCNNISTALLFHWYRTEYNLVNGNFFTHYKLIIHEDNTLELKNTRTGRTPEHCDFYLTDRGYSYFLRNLPINGGVYKRSYVFDYKEIESISGTITLGDEYLTPESVTTIVEFVENISQGLEEKGVEIINNDINNFIVKSTEYKITSDITTNIFSLKIISDIFFFYFKINGHPFASEPIVNVKNFHEYTYIDFIKFFNNLPINIISITEGTEDITITFDNPFELVHGYQEIHCHHFSVYSNASVENNSLIIRNNLENCSTASGTIDNKHFVFPKFIGNFDEFKELFNCFFGDKFTIDNNGYQLIRTINAEINFTSTSGFFDNILTRNYIYNDTGYEIIVNGNKHPVFISESLEQSKNYLIDIFQPAEIVEENDYILFKFNEPVTIGYSNFIKNTDSNYYSIFNYNTTSTEIKCYRYIDTPVIIENNSIKFIETTETLIETNYKVYSKTINNWYFSKEQTIEYIEFLTGSDAYYEYYNTIYYQIVCENQELIDITNLFCNYDSSLDIYYAPYTCVIETDRGIFPCFWNIKISLPTAINEAVGIIQVIDENSIVINCNEIYDCPRSIFRMFGYNVVIVDGVLELTELIPKSIPEYHIKFTVNDIINVENTNIIGIMNTNDTNNIDLLFLQKNENYTFIDIVEFINNNNRLNLTIEINKGKLVYPDEYMVAVMINEQLYNNFMDKTVPTIEFTEENKYLFYLTENNKAVYFKVPCNNSPINFRQSLEISYNISDDSESDIHITHFDDKTFTMNVPGAFYYSCVSCEKYFEINGFEHNFSGYDHKMRNYYTTDTFNRGVEYSNLIPRVLMYDLTELMNNDATLIQSKMKSIFDYYPTTYECINDNVNDTILPVFYNNQALLQITNVNDYEFIYNNVYYYRINSNNNSITFKNSQGTTTRVLSISIANERATLEKLGRSISNYNTRENHIFNNNNYYLTDIINDCYSLHVARKNYTGTFELEHKFDDVNTTFLSVPQLTLFNDLPLNTSPNRYNWPRKHDIVHDNNSIVIDDSNNELKYHVVKYRNSSKRNRNNEVVLTVYLRKGIYKNIYWVISEIMKVTENIGYPLIVSKKDSKISIISYHDYDFLVYDTDNCINKIREFNGLPVFNKFNSYYDINGASMCSLFPVIRKITFTTHENPMIFMLPEQHSLGYGNQMSIFDINNNLICENNIVITSLTLKEYVNFVFNDFDVTEINSICFEINSESIKYIYVGFNVVQLFNLHHLSTTLPLTNKGVSDNKKLYDKQLRVFEITTNTLVIEFSDGIYRMYCK